MADQQQKVEALIATLNITELASLLAGKDIWHTVSVPSKGIQSLRLSDGPNGIRGTQTFNGSRTVAFPCPTAQAATWNCDLMYQIGTEMAYQAKSKGVSVILAPTVNLQRSPLGGRSFECFSEDPVLSGKVGSSLIRGIQDQGIAACVKHFVCNDQETDLMKVNAIVDQRTLREIYLKPFQIIIRESQPWTIMAAYNRVNGIHASESNYLLEDILRKEWGWKGLVMSDCFGVSSCAESINAGLDLEMPGPSIWRTPAHLLRILSVGKISFQTLQARALNVLTLLDRVSAAGIAEDSDEQESITDETRRINTKAAQEAIVLIKNSDGLLPLRNPSSIVIIGPNAKRNLSTGGGSATLREYRYVSAYEGLQATCNVLSPGTELSFAQGCFCHEMLPLLRPISALETPGFDIEFFDGDFEHPGKIQAGVSTDSAQMVFFDSLPKAVTHPAHARVTAKFCPESDGAHEFSLVSTGRAKLYVDGELVVSSWEKQEPSNKFFGLAAKETKGTIVLKSSSIYEILVEYSSISSIPANQNISLGAGILRIGALQVFDEDQLIEDAVRAVSKAEVAILCLGTDQEQESEGYDRKDMLLYGRQNELTERVLAANPNTVILNYSGSPVEMPWADKASSIIQAWFLGSELGTAVANVVFGKYNPSGKLPISFPLKLEDNSSHENFPGEDSVVRYAEGLQIGYCHYTTKSIQTAFPFGHGLSYTTFAYHNFRADSWILDSTKQITISIDVTNTGDRIGSEIVQVYVCPVSPSVNRPLRELKAFAKVLDLAPRKVKTIEFFLDKFAISYFDEDETNWVAAEGKYVIELCSSSESVVLQHDLEVVHTSYWTGLG